MPSQQIALRDFGENAHGHPAYPRRPTWAAFIAFAFLVIFPYPASAHQGTETSWHKDEKTAAAACVAASHAHGYSPWCYASAGVFTTACPPQPGHPHFTNASEYHFWTIEPEWWLGMHRFYYCLVQVAEVCPVPPLTPLADLNAQLSNNDPDTLSLENNPINTLRLTPEMNTALACLTSAMTQRGVRLNLESAFRTEAYQRHLWEIYDRRVRLNKLKGDKINACAALKVAVDAEWGTHGLGGLQVYPAYNAGNHPKGKAIDVSRRTTMAELKKIGVDVDRELAIPCGLRHPMPIKDKGHFEIP